jgi:molybdopterin molybdotransferase
MRPGKPVGLARLGQAVLLGLPSNTFAALTSFVVGRDVLARLRGCPVTGHALSARSGFKLDRHPGRTEFVPARVADHGATAHLFSNGSAKAEAHGSPPLVAADGLGRIDAERIRVEVGDPLGFLAFSDVLRL